MTELSNFQKNFLANSGHMQVFTQAEFDEALAVAKAEIMTVAIETTKTAILIEREACAQIAQQAGFDELANAIRTRMHRAD